VLVFEEAEITINSRFHEPSSVEIKSKDGTETLEFDMNTHGYNFEAAHVQQMLTENRLESTVMNFEKSLELISLLDRIREKIDLHY